MAKTITAMLIGVAIAEGHIRSVDDAAEIYVPGLVGTEYGRTPLRHLLQMSSGVSLAEQGATSTGSPPRHSISTVQAASTR